MTARSALLALADRCEREEPSRELDFDIGSALHGPNICHRTPDGEWIINRTGTHLTPIWDRYMPPRFTTSLDAAVTLVPEALRRWWTVGIEVRCSATVGPLEEPAGCATGKTPAVALCAAALRARADLTGKG